MLRKPLVLFYFLFFYAVLQLIWWGMLLIDIAPERKTMFIGEGIFFLIIFIIGAIKLKIAFDQEHTIHAQQHNFRSEEHTSELQSLMRISYAVFCLTK